VLAITDLMRAMVAFLIAPITLHVPPWTCSRSERLGALPKYARSGRSA
jgi:hypothetical protein